MAKIQAGAKGWPATLGTLLRGDDPEIESLANAFLICRDQILHRLDGKDARITLALFQGEPQDAVGRELGIGQPTVSSRQRSNGPSALVRAHLGLSALVDDR